MPQATLAVTLPSKVWICDVSTAYPDATFSVHAAIPGTSTGFALVRITGENVSAILEDMNDHPQIEELATVQESDNEVTVHFETTAPLLLFSARESGMPIEHPVEIRNGEAILDVTGSRDRMAKLATQLERFGLTFRIEHITERLHQTQLLSDRQLDVILAAVESGYYDTPRTCTLTELADQLDIAKSTCSETLHRAEETIVKRFVEDLPHDNDRETTDEYQVVSEGRATDQVS